jgi:hypothetical protein
MVVVVTASTSRLLKLPQVRIKTSAEAAGAEIARGRRLLEP